MSDNFRQAVEKIQACNDWRHCGVRGKQCYECRIDRICAEVSKLAEGMPRVEAHCDTYERGSKEQYQECQAFIKEQTK